MDILRELELKTAETIKYFKNQLLGIRGGRANVKLVEDIPVEYLEQKLSVKQLGSISIGSPREIQILVWDKGSVTALIKAIESSLNVGVNPEGNLIRINLPPLSEERRQELIKIVKEEAEEARIKIRFWRDEANKKISRGFEDKKITEDDKFKLKEKVQKIIDKTNEEIETILENKTKEIKE
jgi:ribosome recycling factor